MIDAESGERIDVLPDRRMPTVTAWLREHPDVRVVCRDGVAGYAQAVTDADPAIIQVADRWHVWHSLAEAAYKEVAAHSACWASLGPPINEGRRAATTRERWQQVHDLLDKGVGLLECARRLNLGLNTVKRYARHTEPDRMVRAPGYRPTLVDPYRDYLRKRRAKDPAVPVTQLLREIKEQGYPGSANLLMRYITQGRVESDHAALSPRCATALLLTNPDHLRKDQPQLREKLAAACPQVTALAAATRGVRRAAGACRRQRRQTRALDRADPRGRSAVPALLRHRPGTRPGRRRSRSHAALSQRSYRRRKPAGQTA
jgi:hypothetical protein